jgi:hypothetical protein
MADEDKASAIMATKPNVMKAADPVKNVSSPMKDED